MKNDPTMPALDDFPEYVEALAKFNDLKGQLSALELEEQEIQARLREPAETLQESAERLLNGDERELAANDTAEREKLAKVRRRKAVISRAITIQAFARDHAHAEASKAACASMASAYGRYVEAEFRAAKAFAEAQAASMAFRSRLEGAGFSVSTLPLARAPGRPIGLDSGAPFWDLLEEAEAHGYLRASDIGRRPAPPERLEHQRPGDQLIAAGPDGIKLMRIDEDHKPVFVKWIAKPDQDRKGAYLEGWRV